MKFNGIMIIILLVFLLFLINAVSAADANVTVESECSVSILDDSNYDDAVEKLGIAGEDVLGKTIKTPGSTFSDIQTKIDSAKNGDVIRLTGKTYSATENNEISD